MDQMLEIKMLQEPDPLTALQIKSSNLITIWYHNEGENILLMEVTITSSNK